jgi:hypothetical protein
MRRRRAFDLSTLVPSPGFALPANDLFIPGVPMRPFVRVFVGLLLVAVLVGCGRRSRSGAVSGKITYKEQPVNDAALLLYPAGGGAAAPIIIPVTGDGSFRISDVPQGEYNIVVQGAEGEGSDASLLKNIPKNRQSEVKKMMEGQVSPKTIPFPRKYKDLKTTDLKCEITDHDQTLNFELKD